MSLSDEIRQSVAAVRDQSDLEPKIGVVLGSGLGAFAEQLDGAVSIPYREIPNFPVSSVLGHKGELVLGTVQGATCAVMSGRVHYYEGHSMTRVAYPIRVLAGLGVDRIIVTNAAGSINPEFSPGDFMLITDHINLTGDNPLRGPNEDDLGPRFPDMSHTYGDRGRRALRDAAIHVGVSLHEGIYVGLAGPSYETPAEIRMLQTLGGDTVGMSTVAETIVASHAGLAVAGLSVITNHAAGITHKALSHDEVMAVGASVRDVVCDLLAHAVANFK